MKYTFISKIMYYIVDYLDSNKDGHKWSTSAQANNISNISKVVEFED
jgi:hypothetical protein